MFYGIVCTNLTHRRWAFLETRVHQIAIFIDLTKNNQDILSLQRLKPEMMWQPVMPGMMWTTIIQSQKYPIYQVESRESLDALDLTAHVCKDFTPYARKTFSSFLVLCLVHCKQITCPPGTETCKFNSKYSEDGKTAEVHYTCLDSKGMFRSIIELFDSNSFSFVYSAN